MCVCGDTRAVDFSQGFFFYAVLVAHSCALSFNIVLMIFLNSKLDRIHFLSNYRVKVYLYYCIQSKIVIDLGL